MKQENGTCWSQIVRIHDSFWSQCFKQLEIQSWFIIIRFFCKHVIVSSLMGFLICTIWFFCKIIAAVSIFFIFSVNKQHLMLAEFCLKRNWMCMNISHNMWSIGHKCIQNRRKCDLKKQIVEKNPHKVWRKLQLRQHSIMLLNTNYIEKVKASF